MRSPKRRRSSSRRRPSTATSEPSTLSSLRNPRVQRARRLHRRSHRREEQAFLLEGERALSDALDAGALIEELFVAEELARHEVARKAAATGSTIHVVGWQIVKAISASVTPQGLVAVVRSPLRGLGEIEPSAGLVLVLAGVGDPGNVGTLIRTAAAGGLDAVVLTEGSADPLNPKTARASAAALFATTIVADVDLPSTVGHLRELGYRTVGTEADATASLYDSDLTTPVALVLGNEAWGLPDDQSHLLDQAVSIPMPGDVESLNVAIAGSIVVFEALRQRMAAGAPKVSSALKGGIE